MSLTPMPEVLAALRAGKPVIVADDEDRENEGDAILAAELATPEWIAWMVRNTSGFLCAPMTVERAAALELPPMVERNEDSRRTAYTITVDASSPIVTTGISAADRAFTLRALADGASTPASFIRPGHVLPVVAVAGGVRERPGHTEASVELMQLAGLSPVGVIGEIVSTDGSMARMPELLEIAAREGLPVTTIEALIVWLNEADARAEAGTALAVDGNEDAPVVGADTALSDADSHGSSNTVSSSSGSASAGSTSSGSTSRDDQRPTLGSRMDHVPVDLVDRVEFAVETLVPTIHGTFRFRAYHDLVSGADHLAVIAGDPSDPSSVVRIHSECLTGEAFGSLKCECGPQLTASLDLIAELGGVVIYLRGHEGRGIGLINKLRAYQLQEDGLDTLDANLALGLPGDVRDYGAAVAILEDLGLTHVRLLTNNPEKVRQLEERGITVVERVPLIVGRGSANSSYLDAKRDRMGHLLPLPTLVE
ncbi:GTP cyclohydrolase II [Subtercola frigoramans]|uniref:GTP cyclohydrolase-2 n=1 Tax=Subtercola frigoramans TaxID=120298 RepID=A0ABS2L8K6_9MICO|nr:GTP cyclohydrolase II [Subtercola frigoramans]MBM7473349.1 3,4-dihydroxy 2-butanone 4-phosphate synthase/GTP cyclohydrolase II [Subtercola frigoramans]